MRSTAKGGNLKPESASLTFGTAQWHLSRILCNLARLQALDVCAVGKRLERGLHHSDLVLLPNLKGS